MADTTSEVTIKVNLDTKEALKNIKAIERTARGAKRTLAELENMSVSDTEFNKLFEAFQLLSKEKDELFMSKGSLDAFATEDIAKEFARRKGVSVGALMDVTHTLTEA